MTDDNTADYEDDGKREFNIINLFSLRVWFSAMFMGFITGMIPAVLLSLIWDQLGWSIWFFTPVITLIIVYNYCLEAPVYCPACGKRVKLRHSVCHHCGYNSAAPAQD